MTKYYVCIVLFSTLIANASAQISSLEEALATAYLKNDTLQTDRIGLEALQMELGIARSGFLPTLTAEASIQQTEIDLVNTGYSAGLRLSQPLFRGGRSFAAMRAARANIRAGEASLVNIENNVLSAVAEAYADLLLARQLVGLSDGLVTGLSEQLSAEQRRLSLGERTRTDVAQAEARLALARSGLARDRSNLVAAEKIFARFVGEAASEALEPMRLPARLPATLTEAIELARQRSPLIERFRYGAEVADADVAIRRGALLPSVSLDARLQYRDQVFEFTGVEVEQTLGTFGASVQVPIFEAGAARAQLQRAKKTRKLREYEITEALRDLEAEVTSVYEDFRATSVALSSNEQAVSASREALRGVRTEAQYGTRSTIEVLDAEAELAAAERALAETRRDLQVAAVFLLATMGTFGGDDLGLDGGNVHYEGTVSEGPRPDLSPSSDLVFARP